MRMNKMESFQWEVKMKKYIYILSLTLVKIVTSIIVGKIREIMWIILDHAAFRDITCFDGRTHKVK